MACNDCGTVIRGSKAYCETCALDRLYGGRGADDAPEQPDSVTVECTACGTVYDHDGSNSCPDCDARRRRYAGDRDAAEC